MPGNASSALLIAHQKACVPNDSNSHFVASSLNATHVNGTKYSNALILATAGDVTVVLSDGSTSLLPSMIAGVWHTCAPFEHIRDTGTTATVTQVGRTFN